MISNVETIPVAHGSNRQAYSYCVNIYEPYLIRYAQQKEGSTIMPSSPAKNDIFDEETLNQRISRLTSRKDPNLNSLTEQSIIWIEGVKKSTQNKTDIGVAEMRGKNAIKRYLTYRNKIDHEKAARDDLLDSLKQKPELHILQTGFCEKADEIQEHLLRNLAKFDQSESAFDRHIAQAEREIKRAYRNIFENDSARQTIQNQQNPDIQQSLNAQCKIVLRNEPTAIVSQNLTKPALKQPKTNNEMSRKQQAFATQKAKHQEAHTARMASIPQKISTVSDTVERAQSLEQEVKQTKTVAPPRLKGTDMSKKTENQIVSSNRNPKDDRLLLEKLGGFVGKLTQQGLVLAGMGVKEIGGFLGGCLKKLVVSAYDAYLEHKAQNATKKPPHNVIAIKSAEQHATKTEKKPELKQNADNTNKNTQQF